MYACAVVCVCVCVCVFVGGWVCSERPVLVGVLAAFSVHGKSQPHASAESEGI